MYGVRRISEPLRPYTIAQVQSNVDMRTKHSDAKQLHSRVNDAEVGSVERISEPLRHPHNQRASDTKGADTTH